MSLSKAGIVILTHNAEPWAVKQIEGLQRAGVTPSQVLVIDSSSKDRTRTLFAAYGAEILQIRQSDFNHGGTRRLGAERFSDKEFLIYLTQDAIPADAHTISALLDSFADPEVAMAYGRQLPRPEAGIIEAHARHFNYPDKSKSLRIQDSRETGTKATFASDSFAAYRSSALSHVGGFPEDVFFAEDQIIAAKMLLAGFKKTYAASARVYHSHSYTLIEEFRRSFDVGVFHSKNRWITEQFGKPEGEGYRFVASELRFVMKHAPFRLIEVIIRTLIKYAGYKIGNHERFLSNTFKQRFSASAYYWKATRIAKLKQRVEND